MPVAFTAGACTGEFVSLFFTPTILGIFECGGKFGNGPNTVSGNTVSGSTVSNTELSEFFGAH